MKKIKYFVQYLVILFFFGIFKLIGLNNSRNISAWIFVKLGSFMKKNRILNQNLSNVYKNMDQQKKIEIAKKVWSNYGKIFAEYIFIKDFKNNTNISKSIVIENSEILKKIKIQSEPVIFVSGHFNNFELMAMSIEKLGIDLAAIYRPLNNIFLNPIMEDIRKKYICKKQIPKGISGTKKILQYFKNGTSIALMIDQRVTEGIMSELFDKKALTTTIPGQFVKKFNAKIVPVYIERLFKDNFKIKFYQPLNFENNANIEIITQKLNKILEEMINKNPDQWIWTHDRWK
jgi:KDO2-lipid IV(A) lauroyltransferase